MMSILITLYGLLFTIISGLLVYQIFLFFIAIKKKEKKANNLKLHSFLILIPAFREGKILINTIDALKKLNYPPKLVKIVLLNDDCDEKVIDILKESVEVLYIDIKFHTKIESLKAAIDISKNFDFVVILDADNLVHPEFLQELNKSITGDIKIVQGLRLPKDLNSNLEKIDALTDFVYNEIDRIIPSRINLTGTLSGSGFAIKSDLFREIIPLINTTGGFDKILQSILLLRDIPVKICEEALVFDEKVTSKKQYIRQRIRWLYFHFYNALKYGLRLIGKGIITLNFNQIHLGLVSLRPPINILYFISSILIFLGVWICKLCAIYLFSLLLIFSFIIFTILHKNRMLSLKLILLLPVVYIYQFKSLLKIKEARKSSLNTEHFKEIIIEDILQKEKSSK